MDHKRSDDALGILVASGMAYNTDRLVWNKLTEEERDPYLLRADEWIGHTVGQKLACDLYDAVLAEYCQKLKDDA